MITWFILINTINELKIVNNCNDNNKVSKWFFYFIFWVNFSVFSTIAFLQGIENT